MISDQDRTVARLHLDIAYALYRARERAGLSIEVLGERAGLMPDRILMIEEGDTTSLTEVLQLCEALGIGVATLFSEVDHDWHATKNGAGGSQNEGSGARADSRLRQPVAVAVRDDVASTTVDPRP